MSRIVETMNRAVEQALARGAVREKLGFILSNEAHSKLLSETTMHNPEAHETQTLLAVPFRVDGRQAEPIKLEVGR